MSERNIDDGARPEHSLIPDEMLQVAWSTRTPMPTGRIDEAWERIKRMGLVGPQERGGEGGAGWGVPDWLSNHLSPRLQSPETLEGTREMEPGTKVRDFPKDSYAVVVEVDDERRSILFKSDWPEKVPGKKPPFYTYRISLESDAEGAVIVTELRATNVKHSGLLQEFGPGLDGGFMKLFAEGLLERVEPEQAALLRQARAAKAKRDIGFAAAIGVGIIGWRLAKRWGNR